ncbi:MAG: hypothetical protein AAFQ94_30120 [Bacteroidota bacterium]
MDGFYVFGGGMGHLSRIKKFISSQKITDFKIFTGNPLADRFFAQDRIKLFRQGKSDVKTALQEYLAASFQNQYFDNFYVDCFPAGILYELTIDLIHAKQIHYLTRHVKQNSYQFNRTTIKFDSCIALEELSADQIRFLRKRNIPINHLQLLKPIPNFDLISKEFRQCVDRPRWLIVHSNNIDEIGLLVMKANQLAEVASTKPQLFLISDNNSENDDVYWIKNEMNPINYFSFADKIFSGAGFNMIHELQEYPEKHVCLPFQRKYDDQQYRLNNRDANF